VFCTHGHQHVGRDEGNKLCIRAMRASVYANVLVLLLKSFAWYKTGAISYLAGIIEIFLDLVISLMNFLIMIVSRKPASFYYRFGYGKIESLGALLQSVMMLYGSGWLIIESLRGLVSSHTVHEHGLGIILILLSTVVTLLLVCIQQYTLRRTSSLLVSSDAIHARGHLLFNLGILIALVASYYNVFAWIDPVFGVGVALYMIWGACKVGRHSLRGLLDAEVSEEARKKIEKIIMQHKKIAGFHKLRTRYSGSEIFVQAHIEMSGAISLLEAHDIAHAVEAKIVEAFPGAQVVLHQDPVEEEEEHAKEF